MISKPTTPQLIDAACTELENRVAPAITDGATKVVVDMALAVLRGAAIRSANEVAWMREEAHAVDELAQRLIAELPDARELAEAHRAYAEGSAGSLYLEDVLDDYERASEVLSRAAEAVYLDGSAERIAAVRRLYDQRMANEKAVIGVFMAAGRT
jgi:hypothetical protein